MAKTVTQNGVSFTGYKNSSDGILPFTAGIMVSGTEGVDPDFGGIINAVDIDWNSAGLSSAINALSLSGDNISVSEFNTSGDLIKAMAKMEKQIQALTVWNNNK
ncbi:MAG: hypothetical protein IK000_00045 [Bacteroidaceae bacterium]|nr:hypothetical protein [Bacteroidaceae bacterium]